MLINNEQDKNFKMAVFNHQNGFQVQLIDGLNLEYDEVLTTALAVVALATKYGFVVSENRLKNYAVVGM